MLNRRCLAILTAILTLSSVARAVTAPVVQLSPTASGPITFSSAAVGGGSSSVTVQFQINQNGPVTITAPASANSHVEFTVGTITGCTANGVTSVSSGTTCTVPINFTPYYAGQRSVPLAVTLNGQVYSFGLTGLGTGPQSHLDTTNLTTLAGSSGTTSSTAYTYKTGISLSPPSNAIIYQPQGVAVDSLNNVFLTDYGHDLVRVAYQTINPQLACLIITENPTAFGLAANANTCAGATSQPITGDLYTVAGVGGTNTYNGDNQLASNAQLGAPGVQVDAAGNIFLGDQINNRVRVIYQGGANIACLIQIENPATFGVSGGSCATATSMPTPGFIYTIAGTGTNGYAGDGGLATSAQLYGSNDTTIDAAGDIFMMNFTPSATITIGGRIRVIYNGGALAAQLITLENPTVTTPVMGDIYTVAGYGTTESGDGNLATSTQVGALTIYGLRVDAYDNVYFSDKTYGSTSYGNSANTSRIRVVYNGTTANPNPLANLIALENPTTVANAAAVKPGYIYTIAGQTGTASPAGAATGSGAGTVDGVLATAQQFAGIYGLALDAAGDILCADRLGFTIRRISAASGIITTVAGFPSSSAGSTFNASGSAQYFSGAATGVTVPTGIGQLFGPWPIALDSAGGIYFADYLANRVRYLATSSSSTYPLLLPAATVGSVSGIQGFEITNIGTPGSTLTITSDSVTSSFGYLSPSGIPGITECASTSTTTPQSSTITTAVSLSAGQSCSFGFAGYPTNGGTNTGTAVVTDNSLNATNATHTMYVSLSATGVTTVITSTTSPIVAGQPTTFVATLTTAGIPPLPVTCGTVNFYVNGSSTPIPATLDPVLGTATITTSNVVSPSTTVSTVYAGSTSGASCSNSAFTQSSTSTAFSVAQTIVTLTSSNYTPNLNQSITLTATVSSPLSNGPFTGNITFLDGKSTTLASVAVNSSGVATYTTSSLAAGSHSLNASYASDPNYVSASTLTSTTVVVTAPAFNATLTSSAGIAISQGQNGIATYAITGVGGYSGTITVSCAAPLPPDVGCLYQPASYTFTGTNSTQNGTVTITTQQLSAQVRHGKTMYFAWLLPGAFLALVFGSRKASCWQRGLLATVGVLVLFAGISGCGSGVVTPAPYGTYNVNVTFTDGTSSMVVPVTISVVGHSY